MYVKQIDQKKALELVEKGLEVKVLVPGDVKNSWEYMMPVSYTHLALNLPKFMEAGNKEKAQTLLNIIGVGPQLAEYEQTEKELYSQRLAIGRIADQKDKYAKEPVSYTHLVFYL